MSEKEFELLQKISESYKERIFKPGGTLIIPIFGAFELVCKEKS